MADFCKQCSEEIFGKDFGDLEGITPIGKAAEGLFCTVLCEGCGVIQVDPDGRCISKDCLEKHGEERTSA